MNERPLKPTPHNIAKSIFNVGTNTLSVLFPEIAIFKSVFDEVSKYIDPKWMQKRCNDIGRIFIRKLIDRNAMLVSFSEEEQAQKVSESINNAISSLSEHNYFTLRRDLRYLFTDAQPELLDPLIDTIIEFIYGDKEDDNNGKSTDHQSVESESKDVRSMSEEVLEILTSFNAHDIDLLRAIKQFQKKGDQSEKKKLIQKAKENEKSQTEYRDMSTLSFPSKYNDRIIIRGENTIIWKDFTMYLGLSAEKSPFERLLTEYPVNQERKPVLDYAYLARSIVKLQNLGLFETDVQSTLGIISTLNIERIHITVFGKEIMRHIKDETQNND